MNVGPPNEQHSSSAWLEPGSRRPDSNRGGFRVKLFSVFDGFSKQLV